MIFILIGMLPCSKLSYDFYILNTISSPLSWGKNPQSQDQVFMSKTNKQTKKRVARGQEVNFTKKGNTLNELSKNYTIADMNIIS